MKFLGVFAAVLLGVVGYANSAGNFIFIFLKYWVTQIYKSIQL